MPDMFKNGEELYKFFTDNQKNSKIMNEKPMVSTKVRKDVLVDERQGKLIINGTVMRINFENIGGGVYKAFLDKL